MTLLNGSERKKAKRLRANGLRKGLSLASWLQSLLAREKRATREDARSLGKEIRLVVTKLESQAEQTEEDLSGFMLCHQFFGGTHKIIENLSLFS